jgi:methyl-accepting chemotaxis protein
MKEYIDVTSTNTQALVDATNRLRDVEISPIKISRSIERIVAKMDELCNSVEQTSSKLGSAFVDISSVTNHVEDAKSQLNSLASKIDDSSKLVSDEMMKVSMLTQSATGYLETIKSSAEELERNTSETTSIVDIIETKAVDTLDRLTTVIVKLDKTLDDKSYLIKKSE